MYSVSGYGKMIVDGARVDAHVNALRATVKPNSIVLDLGCGPGLFALIAAQLGARRVFAIEPDSAIQIGRDAAREYGLEDRIEFIQDVSTNVTLPERADIIISDLRGVLPLLQQHVPSIVDARSRLLAPGGVLIPSRDSLWAALVEAPEAYEDLVKPWEQNWHGATLHSGRKFVVNSWIKLRVPPEALLGPPVRWHDLDYYTIEETDVIKDVSLGIDRNGTAHGLSVWFDAELFGDIGFSNAPGEELIYANAFFPFEHPLEVVAGDRIDVRFEARLMGDDYTWVWKTTLISNGRVQSSFKQSTLFAAPLSISELRKRASGESRG